MTLGGSSIAEVAALPIVECADFLRTLDLDPREAQIAERVLKEVNERLRFLLDVGLDYLTLDRPAATLAGGEAQRIRLATQIGSAGRVLYVLDEPSIGLHQRDNQRLHRDAGRLRDLGNTLIVVEHDEDTIRAADWVVDIGPGAASTAGRSSCPARVEDLLAKPGLADRRSTWPATRASPCPRSAGAVDPGRTLVIEGAREHNLHDVDVEFPLGCFVAVTGVSGSGKSTLVNDILYTALARELNGARTVPGRHKRDRGVEHLDKVVHVDQRPIGRTPRSNPATYTGVFDHVRKLFAQTPARPRSADTCRAGSRSTSRVGGAKRARRRHDQDRDELPARRLCRRARCARGALQPRDPRDALTRARPSPRSWTCRSRRRSSFFAAVPPIARHLQTLNDVGLGYVRWASRRPHCPAGRRSGSSWPRSSRSARPAAPSTSWTSPPPGCISRTSRKLLGVLHSLVDKGNTVIVIEHNLDVVKTADWIIDIGPEGGTGGGLVVATGTPEEVAAVADSTPAASSSASSACAAASAQTSRARIDASIVTQRRPTRAKSA